MSELRPLTVTDIYTIPERSALTILFVSLKAVEYALIVEHPTVKDDGMIEPEPPISLSIAGRIVETCSQMRNLIEQYDRAVDNALGLFDEDDDCPF